jgi:ATP-binding protein involved in chromosome partitioning
MGYSREQVLDALRHVTHPESGNNIATLGMVEDIIIEGQKISFTLFFNRSNDPFIASIQKACVKAIEKYIGADAQVVGNITIRFHEVAQSEKPLSNVKNIIAVASGKGGVGKSTVAANLAVGVAMTGAKVGLIDADIFGPSVPLMFGAEDYKPTMTEENGKSLIVPLEKYGVKTLSIGYFVEAANPLVWRGPMAANALKQLLFDTAWGELDYLFLDMPPGTSDIHLSIVQELSVTGAIIVSTPQKVALADVVKGINMFRGDKINVPILGLVENMAWFTPAELPENKYYIFGKEGCKGLTETYDVPLLGQIPLVQSICEGGDNGVPAVLDQKSIVGKAFNELCYNTIKAINTRNKNLPPTSKVEMQNTLKF